MSNVFLEKISKDPLNAELHFEYALECFENKRNFLAFAELQTAEFLGLDSKKVSEYKESFILGLPELPSMNHNAFFRVGSLAKELQKRAKEEEFSVLEVGGGQGHLASFIPNAKYCLAEPISNGISGESLPFSSDSFDYVVSCHVLEHIPIPDRDFFLDNLLSKSKKGLILLNPFSSEGVVDRINLVYDITKYEWAREHLEYTLPELDYIKEYAKERDLAFDIEANGNSPLAMAMVFVDYFARRAGLVDELKRVDKYYNTTYDEDILTNEEYPIGYMVYIAKK